MREKTRAAHLDNVRFLHAGLGEGKLERHQFDRALLVTVLGEIPEREAAFKELFGALKISGTLSVTEVIFDPHFQSRRTVTRLARAVGLREKAFYGSRLAYTVIFEKLEMNRSDAPDPAVRLFAFDSAMTLWSYWDVTAAHE